MSGKYIDRAEEIAEALKYQEEAEKEFGEKVLEIQSYYQGNIERTTIDGEWTESELKDDLYSEALHILNGTDGKPGWLEKHKNCALLDKDLTFVEYLVEHICSKYDMIEVYNRCYDLHRNDKPMMFGIHYFDEVAREEVIKTLNNNLVAK
jgi:hypothetical protein